MALQGRFQPLGLSLVSSTRLPVCSEPCPVPLSPREKSVFPSSLNPAGGTFVSEVSQSLCSLPGSLGGCVEHMPSRVAGTQSVFKSRVRTSSRISSQNKATGSETSLPGAWLCPADKVRDAKRRCKPNSCRMSPCPWPSSQEQQTVPYSSPFLLFEDEYNFLDMFLWEQGLPPSHCLLISS